MHAGQSSLQRKWNALYTMTRATFIHNSKRKICFDRNSQCFVGGTFARNVIFLCGLLWQANLWKYKNIKKIAHPPLALRHLIIHKSCIKKINLKSACHWVGRPCNAWWRHQMETFSAVLAICAGNSPVPGEFRTQRPETRSFDVFFDLRLNKRLSKRSWGWWFETLSCPLRRQCNGK